MPSTRFSGAVEPLLAGIPGVTVGVWEPVTLALVGVALLALAVAGLRTMARRSVSLRALRAIQAGTDPREPFEAGIATRITEMEQHGLARMRHGLLTLTSSGRRIVSLTRLLRRLTGVRR